MGTSLPKVIKYVKRGKYSFHDFSAKHTPSATLNDIHVYVKEKPKPTLDICYLKYFYKSSARSFSEKCNRHLEAMQQNKNC